MAKGKIITEDDFTSKDVKILVASFIKPFYEFEDYLRRTYGKDIEIKISKEVYLNALKYFLENIRA